MLSTSQREDLCRSARRHPFFKKNWKGYRCKGKSTVDLTKFTNYYNRFDRFLTPEFSNSYPSLNHVHSKPIWCLRLHTGGLRLDKIHQ